MLLTLIFATMMAGMGPTPIPAATEPPTIVTIKSSNVCTAIRNVIAPSIQGLIVQDRIIQHGQNLMQDMAAVQAEGGDGWVAMENVHLGNDVYHLAANNTKVHQLLDQLSLVKPKDQQTADEVATLHARLQAIADAQAVTLNIMSGLAASNDLAAITQAGNDQGKAVSGRAVGGKDYAALAGAPPGANPATLVAWNRRNTQVAESALQSALLPVVNRCR